MTSPKILTLVIVVVIFQVSLQQHDSTLEEKIRKSRCRPSEKQKAAYKDCAKAMYGRDDLTLAELQNEEIGKRLGPCVWSKLGLFGKNGFDKKVFEDMINEMPVDESVKQGFRDSAEVCQKETGVTQALKCVAGEIKKVCDPGRGK